MNHISKSLFRAAIVLFIALIAAQTGLLDASSRRLLHTAYAQFGATPATSFTVVGYDECSKADAFATGSRIHHRKPHVLPSWTMKTQDPVYTVTRWVVELLEARYNGAHQGDYLALHAPDAMHGFPGNLVPCRDMAHTLSRVSEELEEWAVRGYGYDTPNVVLFVGPTCYDTVRSSNMFLDRRPPTCGANTSRTAKNLEDRPWYPSSVPRRWRVFGNRFSVGLFLASFIVAATASSILSLIRRPTHTEFIHAKVAENKGADRRAVGKRTSPLTENTRTVVQMLKRDPSGHVYREYSFVTNPLALLSSIRHGNVERTLDAWSKTSILDVDVDEHLNYSCHKHFVTFLDDWSRAFPYTCYHPRSWKIDSGMPDPGYDVRPKAPKKTKGTFYFGFSPRLDYHAIGTIAANCIIRTAAGVATYAVHWSRVHRFASAGWRFMASDGYPAFVRFVAERHTDNSRLASLATRVMCEMPPQDPAVMAQFYAFAEQMVALIDPIGEVHEDFDDYVDTLDLPKSVRINLCREHEDYHDKKEKFIASVKDETNDKPKTARSVMCTSHVRRVLIAQVQNKADKSLYASFPHFVKGMTRRQQAVVLRRFIGRVTTTDFTAMEAHHNETLARVTDLLLDRLWANNRNHPAYEMMLADRSGTRTVKSGGIKATMEDRLASGMPWTSSANGFLNLCIIGYLWAKDRGINDPAKMATEVRDNFVALVEGDDGIAEYYKMDEELIKGLGLKLKPEVFDDYESAAFCSFRMCHIGDVCVPIIDPLKAISNFMLQKTHLMGAKEKKKQTYLRARALSLYHAAYDTPVAHELAARVLELTEGLDARAVRNNLTWWEKIKLDAAVASTDEEHPSLKDDPKAKAFVEEVYGLSIMDQETIIAAIKSWDGKGDIVVPADVAMAHEDARAHECVRQTPDDLAVVSVVGGLTGPQ